MKKLIALLLLVASVAYAQAQSGLELRPYQFKSRSGETVDAELGEFQVSENRQNPDARKIKLSFVRFKSTNPNPGPPIIYLAGGPGGSGIATARGQRFPLFMALREVADVIAFDQRGTGLSNQIPGCKEAPRFAMDRPGSSELYIGKMREATKSCMTFWENEGVDLAGYNTEQSADDLEELRKQLGAEKITLWGISYGTHLAFNFAKRYESSLDRMVLASLEGPDHTIKLPSNTDAMLELLAERIKNDPIASKEYPDLTGMMRRVLAGLEAQPLVTEARDPRSGKSFKVAISAYDVRLITSFMFMKNPEDSKKLPRAYKLMDQGNFTEMAMMVAGLRQMAGRVSAMPTAMDAMSGISAKRWKQVEKEAKTAILGRTTNFPFPDLGEGLGFPSLNRDFRKNPKSKVPALFFSGTLDGRTYLPAAKELVKGFKNGRHVIIDGAGHDLFMSSPKVTELILQFLKGEEVKSHQFSIKTPAFLTLND